MKTLVNKNNPQIRITAPDGMVKNRTNCWAIWSEGDRLMLLDKDHWTLVEEESKHTEVWVEGRTIFEQKPVENPKKGCPTYPLSVVGDLLAKMPPAPIRFTQEQKPAEWSEEDEHRCGDAIYFLETAKKHYADTSEIELTIDWLKSLRPKPKVERSVEKGPVDLEKAAIDYGMRCYKRGFVDGKEWAFKQFSDILGKWQEHAIEGMRVGASAYHQGKIALICDLRDWIKEQTKKQ